MSARVPHAAFCEEYDEDTNVTLPETRKVANAAAKRSKSDLRPAETGVDVASDSGYSSRTAATVNSGQSVPSGRKSPTALKLDPPLKGPDKEKLRESRKEKGKEMEGRPVVADDRVSLASRRSSSRPPSHHRSPSRPRRRESVRHHPETCWECQQGLYPGSPPVELRSIDYPYYYPHPPPAPDYPPSPKSTRFPPLYVPDVHVSQGGRRSRRSNSYHSSSRPVSFHGVTPEMGMYSMVPMSHYEHGPPLSASAYANAPTFPPPPFPQQPQYYGRSDAVPQSPYDRPRERSRSRTREPKSRRRASVYGPPIVDYAPPTPTYEDGAPLERRPSREHRSRIPSPSYDRDEDYYRMPPPPSKPKPPPQVIQKRRPDPLRKPAPTTVAPPARRLSQSLDLSDLEDALPDDRPLRKVSRETIVPERSRSVLNGRRRRTTSYHESSRSSRSSVEDSRRRRLSVYDYEPRDIEQKQREAEEYQAARSGKTVPLTADALSKAKSAHRPDSDSESQQSRSTSSRGSDVRTRDGSGVGSKYDDDSRRSKNKLVMTMNGLEMSIPQDQMGGKRINLKTDEQGAVVMKIAGRRPKKYLRSRSDHASTSGRTDIEDYRRARDDRRSDRASRRSSRSTYGRRRLLE